MPKNQTYITPRKLYVLMEALTFLMVQLQRENRHKQANEVHELWLELEEQWDALPAKDTRRAVSDPDEFRFR